MSKLSDDAKVRAKAKKLLSKAASTNLLAALKQRLDMRRNMHLGSRFRYDTEFLENTEIDLPKLAMYYFLFRGRKAGGADFIFNNGSEELIHYFIKKHLIQNDEIELDGRNNDIKVFPRPLLKYTKLRKIAVRISPNYSICTMEEMFPEDLLKLDQLEELTIKTSGYVLPQIPKCLLEHPSLKKITWYQRESQVEKDFRVARPDLEIISDITI